MIHERRLQPFPPGYIQQLKSAEALDACFKGKDLPNISKKEIYVEGEIDGKYFSISKNENFDVRSSLKNFFALGYNSAYSTTTDWQGNGFSVYPVVSDSTTKDQNNFYLDIGFSAFQGDSLAYIQYFEQFQKGKSFKFRNNDYNVKSATELQAVDITIAVFGCSSSAPITKGNGYSSMESEQNGSYFRVADVKNYLSTSGQIYKRDVTIEFDIKLAGGVTTKRIKNGRLFFSY